MMAAVGDDHLSSTMGLDSEPEDREGGGAGSSGSGGNSRRREKKSRVSTACLECRRRKSKCDGKTPCSGCQAKGLSCNMIFDDRRRKQSVAAGNSQDSSDLRALQERCKYLERLVMKSHGQENDKGRDGQTSSSAVPVPVPGTASAATFQQPFVAFPDISLSNSDTSPPTAIRKSPNGEQSTSNFTQPTSTTSFTDQFTRNPGYNAMTIPLFDFGTNDASYQGSSVPPATTTMAHAPTTREKQGQDVTSNLQALSSTLNISNLGAWAVNNRSEAQRPLISPSAILSYPQAASLSSGDLGDTSSRTAPPSATLYSGSDASASPSVATRSIYVPPAQSLTEDDMLEPMPRTALETIHAGKATPLGIETGSLAHQLARRDGRMTLADGGKLRYYGATSARSLSYGGLHFQSRGRKQVRDLNATCRMALNKAGYLPDSIFEDYGFQQRIVA